MATTHLVIISDRTALSWVLTAQRMAFPPSRARAAHSINEGDEVLLYSTRGCFGNPNRDVGRILGHTTMSSPVRTLAEPVVFAERNFTEGCELTIHGLAPSWKAYPYAITFTGSASSQTRAPGVSACAEPPSRSRKPTPPSS